MNMRLVEGENVYYDEGSCGWYDEYENPVGTHKHWTLVGVFSTRRDAIAAVIKTRPKKSV